MQRESVCLQAAGSHPRRGDLRPTDLCTVRQSQHIKENEREGRERKKDALHIHMFCISAGMDEDDISFLSPSHLQRANSICTPSCF